MPQLMPLNWVFSSIMLILIMVSMGILYSDFLQSNEIMKIKSNHEKLMGFWCW